MFPSSRRSRVAPPAVFHDPVQFQPALKESNSVKPLPTIHIRGLVNSYTSYGMLLQRFALDFMDLGYPVVVIPIGVATEDGHLGTWVSQRVLCRVKTPSEPHAWELMIAPNNYRPEHLHTFLYTMFECSRTNAQHLTVSAAEHLAVPCAWNQELVPWAQVIPLGVDLDVFRPKPLNMGGPCVFGTAGRLSGAGGRKSADRVVQAFLETFRGVQDVRLDVKCYPDDPAPVCDDPRVRILARHMSVEELAELYVSWTCLVHPSMGEAWGMMIQEAMAVGRPVITPIHGGPAMYLDKTCCYPLEFKSCSVATRDYTGTMIAPDHFDLVSQMRSVYEDRGQARRIGLLAAEKANRFSIHRTSFKLLRALRDVGYLKE